MKKIISLVLGLVLWGTSNTNAQDVNKGLGINAMVLSAKDIYLGDSIQVTLYLWNHKFSNYYDPALQPLFISVGLPAASKIVILKDEILYGRDSNKFAFGLHPDSFNFTFDVIDSVGSILSGRNNAIVAFSLLGVHLNPTGSAPQFLLQLQYPFGDPSAMDPLLFSAMSPVLTVSAPLSLGLGMFTAIKSNQNTVDLDWSTLSEQANKGFEIEKSKDGKNWSSIGFVASLAENGNSTATLKYQFEDVNPFQGENYYRLKQVGINGKVDYSDVRKVVFNNDQTTVSIFPNPASQNLTIQGVANGDVIYVHDVAGKLVKLVCAYNTTVDFNVSDLAAGTYFLRVNQDKFQTKFVKQ